MHKNIEIVLGMLIFIALIATASAQENDPCDTVQNCMREFNAIVEKVEITSYGGLKIDQKRFENLKRHATKLGDPLVDELVPLLGHSEIKFATIAARILSSINRIDKKHFPRIKAGLDRKIHGLSPTLFSIGTDEAAEEAVKRYLNEESIYDPNGDSIKKFDRQAVPYIIKAVKCEYGCNRNTLRLLRHVVLSFSAECKMLVAKSMIEVATNEKSSHDQASDALSLATIIGKKGIIFEKELLIMRDERFEIAEQINEALIAIGSKESGKIFSDLLRNKTLSIIQRIRNLGPTAVAAGPEVLNLVDHSDPSIRFAAAEALASIGYKESFEQVASTLAELLWDPKDLNINIKAAMELGDLNVKSSVVDLEKAADEHWYPVVRRMAKYSIKKIHKNNGSGGTEVPDYPPQDIYHVKSCKRIKLKELDKPSDKIAHGKFVNFAERPDNKWEVQIADEKTFGIGVRTENGWLIGHYAGEWGGGLTFYDNHGNGKVIRKFPLRYVTDMFRFGDRYVALTGMEHMGSNYGSVYEIHLNADKEWVVEHWRNLPKAPSPGSSWLVETGEIFIDTSGGGSLLLSQNGDFRMADCVGDYESERDYDKAILEFTEFLEDNPKDGLIYYERGLVYFKQGEYDKAIADFDESIRIDPEDADAYYARGTSYYHTEKFDSAISDYSKAIKLLSYWVSPYDARALAYWKIGNLEKARADCKRAIELNPKPNCKAVFIDEEPKP